MPDPTLCLECGSDRPSASLALCPQCARPPLTVRWSAEPITARYFFKRAGAVLGAFFLSALFTLPCVALSFAWLYPSLAGRLLQSVVWVLVVPLSAALAVFLPWTAARDAVSRTHRFAGEDPKVEGKVVSALGWLIEADGTVAESEPGRDIKGAELSSSEVFHANLRSVRKALCNQGSVRTLWRNSEVLIFSALAGMIDRGEIRVTHNAGRWWSRKRDQLTRGDRAATSVRVCAASGRAPAGWLERRIFDALPPPRYAGLGARGETTLEGPFREPSRVDPVGVGDTVSLSLCLSQATNDLLTLQRAMIVGVRDDRSARRPMDLATVLSRLTATIDSDPAAARLVLTAIAVALRVNERRAVTMK